MNKPAPVRKRKINKVVIAFAIYIVVAVAGGCFLAWAVGQPAPVTDQYSDHRRLYDEVISYDFSKGRDHALEERLKKATENPNLDQVRSYYNHKARGYYYANLQFYLSAAEDYEIAIDIAPDKDEVYEIATALYDIYTAIGDTEKAAEYDFTQGGC